MHISPWAVSLPVAAAFTLCGAVAMVGGVSLLRANGYLSGPSQGRKVMHLATGPVFLLCWLLFPPSPWSRFLAALVPFAVASYMGLVSRGLLPNRALVATVSRTGRASELALGPALYGLVHAAAAALYWTDCPTGLVGVLALCVGDGVADLVGRPYGRTRWPHSRLKSVEGSIAFFTCTLAALVLYTHLFVQAGFFGATPWSVLQWQLPLAAGVCALVESLPWGDFDNVGIFVAVAGMGHLLGW